MKELIVQIKENNLMPMSQQHNFLKTSIIPRISEIPSIYRRKFSTRWTCLKGRNITADALYLCGSEFCIVQ